MKAYCFRTEMCGGGTSYDVYFLKRDKPSYPLHNGHTYATVVMRDGKEFFNVEDALDPKARWAMEAGIEKWEAHKRLEKVSKRLAVRIAKRAFPELAKAKELPWLWASWTLPSAVKQVNVRLVLPE